MKRGALGGLLFLLLFFWLVPACSALPDDYIVVEGDTLSGIATRFLGDGSRYPEIVALTNARHASDPSYAHIEDPALIRVGWKLALPEPAGSRLPSPILIPELISDTIPPGTKPKGLLRSIAKVDDYTVKLTFYRYPQGLLSQLAMPALAMHSPAALRNWGREYLYHPVGTGPYLFREWTLYDRIVLEANPDYWGQGPQVKRLVYRVIEDSAVRVAELLTGTVDLIYPLSADDLAVIRGRPDVVLYLIQPNNVGYLAINKDWRDAEGNRALEDVRVRQAIAHAINKEAIVRDLYPGTALVAKNFAPPLIWGYNDDFADYNYNPDRARELLREAGYPNGFQVDLWVMPVGRSYMPDPLRVGRAIQGDLQAVGIRAEIVTHDWDVYLSKVDAGEHALALLGWIPDYPDPDAYLFALFASFNKQWAQAGPPDGRLYELLLRARSELDPRMREQLYYEAHAIIHGLAPGVPIAHNGALAAGRPGLDGFRPSPLYDRWNGLRYVTETLTIALPHDVEGLDIADETDPLSLFVGSQMYEGLVAFEPGTSRIVPALAERWEVSADGLEWTFYLRQGVTFHDGTAFDADAVLFNLDRLWDRTHPYRAGRSQDFNYFYWFFGGFKGEFLD